MNTRPSRNVSQAYVGRFKKDIERVMLDNARITFEYYRARRVSVKNMSIVVFSIYNPKIISLFDLNCWHSTTPTHFFSFPCSTLDNFPLISPSWCGHVLLHGRRHQSQTRSSLSSPRVSNYLSHWGLLWCLFFVVCARLRKSCQVVTILNSQYANTHGKSKLPSTRSLKSRR